MFPECLAKRGELFGKIPETLASVRQSSANAPESSATIPECLANALECLANALESPANARRTPEKIPEKIAAPKIYCDFPEILLFKYEKPANSRKKITRSPI